MPQYLHATVKRYVQKHLFANVHNAHAILGLAGPYPEKYLPMLPNAEKVILVDYDPINPKIHRNSLVGEYDLYVNIHTSKCPITLVDCDFCRSVIGCGDDLLYIYHKMKKSVIKSQYISFTFSLRGVGLEGTITWLKTNIEEIAKYNIIFNTIDIPQLRTRQYVHQAFDLYLEQNINLFTYRDSGDNMISGIIKIQK